LLAWRVLLNGDLPWLYLTLDEGADISEVRAENAPLPVHISESQFQRLKFYGESMLEAAIDTISGRSESDINFEYAFGLLQSTLQLDPVQRNWTADYGESSSGLNLLWKGSFQLRPLSLYKVFLKHALGLDYP
jgi:hypothetical protein